MLLVVVITAIILVVFINISGKVNAISSENADLVVFGENVDPKNKPFVENNAVYISTDTIGKLIDEHIFYDKEIAIDSLKFEKFLCRYLEFFEQTSL